jgi:ubiquinone/menaquinone biosynthesis C-methylase UbiE
MLRLFTEVAMDIFGWIAQRVQPKWCSSAELLYEHMESQSGRCLPIIYQPFDVGDRSHWRDRGAAFDFIYATQGEGRRLLDFGPGDGWPSLIVAPYVAEVVGVDGAHRRVEVCAENAARLGIGNAHFYYVTPGAPLPFEGNSFDGAMAASSLEQTPDPRAALGEIYRVLRPGGRLRMCYESLERYRGGQEREVWLWEVDEQHCRLMLYDRQIDQERVVQYALGYAVPAQALRGVLWGGADPSFTALTIPALEKSLAALAEAKVCTTEHPSGNTWVAWLAEAGFSKVWPTLNGMDMAQGLFHQIAPASRPKDMAALDALLQPIVKAVVELAAPAGIDPMITAVK